VEGEAIAAEIRAAGGQAVFRQTDVSRAADCAALVACALDHFGRLDGAFNNAGLQREFCDIHETPDADISDVIDINLKGMLYMMKYEAEAMLASGGQHRQQQLHLRAQGHATPGLLRGRQARHHRRHPGRRPGLRPQGHPGECRVPRPHQDRQLRPGDRR
jgi:NAD(P)-dependent dehydrogenase (short-subunit alcohol dehydrogenase family)